MCHTSVYFLYIPKLGFPSLTIFSYFVTLCIDTTVQQVFGFPWTRVFRSDPCSL